MKITNKFNVPETLVALASRDFYTKGDADYSVTEIIAPPRINYLRRKHDKDMTQDVSDMLWMLLGTALHVVAERSEIDGHTNEERLSKEIDGLILSGAIDLQKHDDEGITIFDYKFTSVWALMHDKPEWEAQQNIYRYLVEKVKKTPVQGLKICAFVRDWSRREASVKESYPQAPVQVVDIPMWDIETTEEYIRKRLKIHAESKAQADWGDELPECTEDEQWLRETKFAVRKEGRKTAVRVFDTEEEAKELLGTMTEKEKGFIEIRLGEAVRCANNYCGVSEWCTQYQKSIKEVVDVSI